MPHMRRESGNKEEYHSGAGGRREKRESATYEEGWKQKERVPLQVKYNKRKERELGRRNRREMFKRKQIKKEDCQTRKK